MLARKAAQCLRWYRNFPIHSGTVPVVILAIPFPIPFRACLCYTVPMQNISQKRLSDFVAAVWRNYTERGRHFPWRETADPYAIMVSEFMLQQTQTARVVPKYEAWLLRFPTVQSVADATLSDVLSLWSGLGYNRRAKFLYEACKTIRAEHGGALPRDAERLDALPGIGAYTARAIAAFAFNAAEVFIETNIRSAFIHFFFLTLILFRMRKFFLLSNGRLTLQIRVSGTMRSWTTGRKSNTLQ